jgi:hypothetical protein
VSEVAARLARDLQGTEKGRDGILAYQLAGWKFPVKFKDDERIPSAL